MAVTSGFFNSLNHDRLYDVKELASLFDGLLNDGVFSNIGDAFAVTAAGGNSLAIGSGKCWFHTTWLKNDATLLLDAPASALLLPRWDIVVIEINLTQATRENTIKIVSGVAASEPIIPKLPQEETPPITDVYHYPIAYVYRGADTTQILQADITNKVGTPVCPFASGIMNINAILTTLQITGGLLYGEMGAVNIIPYRENDPVPSLEGVPNGTFIVKVKQ